MNIHGVICDDLTGAMDAGVQAVKVNISSAAVFDMKYIEQISDSYSVLMIDTESRNINCDSAKEKLSKTISYMMQYDIKPIYKKIDSTLRGNIGIEIDAVLSAGYFDMIAFVPSLPYNGRTTIDGYHYINGIALNETDIAKDPFSPIKSSYIPDIIRQQSNAETDIIYLADVRKGIDHLKDCIIKLNDNGCKIAVFDCETNDDLNTIWQAIKSVDLNILPCGSAGLFKVIVKDLCADMKTYNRNYKSKLPSLIISGSPAEKSKKQIKVAEENGINTIRLNEYSENEIRKSCELAGGFLSSGRDVIIDGAGKSKEWLMIKYGSDGCELNKRSRMLQHALSEIAKYIMDNIEISGLVIFGGDTSLNILNTIGCTGIGIKGEAEPYIPAGELLDGEYQGLPIITKAGGFGSNDVIQNCIKYLKGEA